MTGVVFSIERYAIHDGPGIRTLIFLKGCPLNCIWCSNPESQSHIPEILYFANKCASCGRCLDQCPQDAIRRDDEFGLVTDQERCNACGLCTEVCYRSARELSGANMSVDDVMSIVLRDRMFYEKSGGGVTISGGEPLLQSHFVDELVDHCRQVGIHTAIETTLFADAGVVTRTLEKIDLVYVDVKMIDSSRHYKYTGVHNEKILKNIHLINDLGKKFIIRVPYIPGVNDDETTQREIYSWGSQFNNLLWIEVLPYHRLGFGKYQALGRVYPMGEQKPMLKQTMMHLIDVGNEFGVEIRIGSL